MSSFDATLAEIDRWKDAAAQELDGLSGDDLRAKLLAARRELEERTGRKFKEVLPENAVSIDSP